MADKNVGHGLQQTKGSFQVRGVVSGTQSDRFYHEGKTSTGKMMRSVNFAVQYDKDSSVYISLNGFQKEKVYFGKSEGDGASKKNVTQTVAWENRFKFNEAGFRLIGVNVGVKKTLDTAGKEVNDKKILTEYDACKEIGENLTDGQSVFVRGQIEYSTYNGKHYTKFVPTQVSLCKDVDFEEDGYEVVSNFTQMIVFQSITPNESKTKFTVLAKTIGFNTIEDAEFIITNSQLAQVFRKNLKPYNAIKVWGNINCEKDVEAVVETDCWGESNEMDKINSPTTRELVITGADPKTIDKELFSEQIIDEGIAKLIKQKQAKEDFNGKSSSNSEWGSLSGEPSEDDEEPW